MPRSDRLLRLVQALRTLPAPVTAARLAEEMGVSHRTLYRDIAALRASGAIIDGEAGVGYVLVEDGAMPPQTLERLELEAVILGLAAVGNFGDQALASAAASAAAKIVGSLDERRQREALHPVLMSYSYIERAPWTVPQEEIRRACWEERALEISYRDKHGAVTERIIEPLAMVYFDCGLALLARCRLRQDYRIFRLDRIVSVQTTSDSFRPRRAAMLREHLALLESRGSQG
ncbi:helix-turn-helix transcriptional regulator [Algicella marina]|uniref:WYL domain-containing protein n=1 Tax=Algicella marina TaxID=2683284 RepID=A0A6P1T5T5_9RHOB|nr:YafY family protein [Algicella marina]QHQ35912.1 WYL domain-containing protein [Algicella marina]